MKRNPTEPETHEVAAPPPPGAMVTPPATRGGLAAWLLWILPVALAVAAYANSFPRGPIESSVSHGIEGIRNLTWGDLPRSKFPLTSAILKSNVGLTSWILGPTASPEALAWSLHLTDVLLHAAAAALAYVVLLELFSRAVLACLGASVYAVLSIHSETLAAMGGQGAGEILGTICLLAVWLLAMRNSVPEESRDPRAGSLFAAACAISIALLVPMSLPARLAWGISGLALLGHWSASRRKIGLSKHAESAWIALGAGLCVFLGLFSAEHVILVVPVVFATSWLLGRTVPWLTIAAALSSALGYWLIRFGALEVRAGAPSFPENPLISLGFLGRFLNSVALLGLYALKIVFPIRLSSDYSFAEINPRTESDPVIWLAALGVAAAAAAAFWFFRRRAHLAVLALAVFLILLAPFSNVLFPARAIFAERFTYAASFAYPIFLCALLAWLGAGARAADRLAAGKIARFATAGICVLILLYGARTWARNRDWALPLPDRLERDAPESAPAHLRLAEACLSRMAASPTQEERKSLMDSALAHVERSLQICPDYGQAQYRAGQLLMSRNERAKAVERFTRAEKLLKETAGSYGTLSSIYRLRGDCYLTLGKLEEAKDDLEHHIQMMKSSAKLPEAMAFNLRGLAGAQLGLFDDALPYFDVAVHMRPDLPTYWNNRGFCRFNMKDWSEAINDYAKGMEVCRNLGIFDAPSGESVVSFMRRIADVYVAQARAAHAEGNDEIAKKAAAEAQQWSRQAVAQAQAAKAGPAPPRLPGSEPILPIEPVAPSLPEPQPAGAGSSMGSSMSAGLQIK